MQMVGGFETEPLVNVSEKTRRRSDCRVEYEEDKEGRNTGKTFAKGHQDDIAENGKGRGEKTSNWIYLSRKWNMCGIIRTILYTLVSLYTSCRGRSLARYPIHFSSSSSQTLGWLRISIQKTHWTIASWDQRRRSRLQNHENHKTCNTLSIVPLGLWFPVNVSHCFNVQKSRVISYNPKSFLQFSCNPCNYYNLWNVYVIPAIFLIN